MKANVHLLPRFLLLQPRGFTLLEILLVLAMLSLISVAVVSTLPVTANNAAKTHAQSLYQKMLLLSDEAILNGKNFGLQIVQDNNSYDIVELTEDKWQLLNIKKIAGHVQFEPAVQLNLELGSGIFTQDDRFLNDSSLFEDRFERTNFGSLNNDETTEQVYAPQIFILASGEITPFTLAFVANANNRSPNISNVQSWRIVGQANSELVLLAPNEELDD